MYFDRMCGCYVLYGPVSRYAKYFDAKLIENAFPARWKLAPSQQAQVVRPGRLTTCVTHERFCPPVPWQFGAGLWKEADKQYLCSGFR